MQLRLAAVLAPDTACAGRSSKSAILPLDAWCRRARSAGMRLRYTAELLPLLHSRRRRQVFLSSWSVRETHVSRLQAAPAAAPQRGLVTPTRLAPPRTGVEVAFPIQRPQASSSRPWSRWTHMVTYYGTDDASFYNRSHATWMMELGSCGSAHRNSYTRLLRRRISHTCTHGHAGAAAERLRLPRADAAL